MTLRQALANKGLRPEEIDDKITSMLDAFDEGADPEELLESEGLEPDYVMDLLNEAR